MKKLILLFLISCFFYSCKSDSISSLESVAGTSWRYYNEINSKNYRDITIRLRDDKTFSINDTESINGKRKLDISRGKYLYVDPKLTLMYDDGGVTFGTVFENKITTSARTYNKER